MVAAERTSRCEQAKAANTLWLRDQSLVADNTDGVGLLRDLSRLIDLQNKRVLLLGAGGAARGILGPLLASGLAQLTITNRTFAKALALQQDFPGIHCCEPMALQGHHDIIINATATSTLQTSIMWPKQILKSVQLAYDLAYTAHGETNFVHWAKPHVVQAVDGLGMLVEQAAEAFYQWHGLMPETTPVLNALRA